jgi:hypothetical protein
MLPIPYDILFPVDITGMIVDKDDNLILADKSFLPMYSMDAKFVKECELRGTAWDVSYYKKVLSS